jgi:protein-glutamine gamma-glutamyltransferase
MVKVDCILQILTYLVVLISYASVFEYVEPHHSICFGLLLAVSIFLHRHRVVRIPRWALNIISPAVLLASLSAVRTEYLVEPVLGALLVLISIKLLEQKSFRDYAQIFAMCIFLLIGSSLLSLSMAFIGYFALIALLSTAALILLAYFAQDSEIVIPGSTLTRVLVQSLLICAIALPSSLLFFIILPRANYPIFSFLNRDGHAMSGFSDSIRLGEISKIHEDNNVVFRAEMAQIDERDLYWRGIVLDQFDGVSWKHGGSRTRASASFWKDERYSRSSTSNPTVATTSLYWTNPAPSRCNRRKCQRA